MTLQPDNIKQLQIQEQTLLDLRNKLNLVNRSISDFIRNGRLNAANKARNELKNIEQEINDLKRDIKNTKAYINLKIQSAINFNYPENEIKKISDTTPIVLFPVRLQTKFFHESDSYQIWIRISPDMIHTHEALLTEDEYLLGCQYIRELFIAKNLGNQSEKHNMAAWQQLATKCSSQRAAWIRRMFLGNKNDITDAGDIAINPDGRYITNWQTGEIGQSEPVFKEITEITLKPQSWSQPSQTQLMPDRFAILLYRGENQIKQSWGNPIPYPLIAGHNPFPDEEPNQELFDNDSKWIIDFEEAKKNGMGLAIDITQEDYELGFSKILAIGIKASVDPSKSSELIQQWIENHHYTDGFAFLPQGTPTNNTEKVKTLYSTSDNYEKSYVVEISNNIDTNNLDKKLDITRIATALNIPSNTFKHIENNDLTENEDARVVQELLWDKTWDYFFVNMLGLQDKYKDEYEVKLRKHYLEFIRARGPFPAIRVGKNPYGLLPITATSKWKSHDTFLDELCQILLKLYPFWKRASENPELTPHVGSTNDPEKELIRILGMDGKAQEIRIRNIVTFNFLWNLLRFTQKQLRKSTLPFGFDQQLINNNGIIDLKSWWAEVNKIKDQNIKILDDLGLTGEPPILKTIAWGSGISVEEYLNGNEKEKTVGRWILNLLGTTDIPNNITDEKLDILVKEILDLSTHRLDAWITSLASKRLNGIRETKNDICIGAYGYLEDVKPKIQNAESNCILCPSLNQAKTAAVLHSAYKNHLGKGNEKAFAINQTSNRVRRALWILEGIQEGQNLGSLLGYQFERALHENYINTSIYLDQYIAPFRELYPVRHDTQNSEADTVSSKKITARNVVDGYNLIKNWQAKEIPFGKNNSGLPQENSPEYNALVTELDALEETYDAFSDLVIPESIHHLLQGNYTRAGAWMNAVSCSGLPAEPENIKTPRSGIELRQRIVLLWNDNPSPEGENTFSYNWPVTPRGRMEPNLSEWVACLLGKTDNIKCQVFWKQDDGNEVDNFISLNDLNIGPLDFLDLAVSANPGGASELEQRIAYYIVNNKGISPDNEIRIKYKITTTNDERSFTELIELSKRIRNFISNGQCPYLKPHDFYLPEEIINGNGYDFGVIKSRLNLSIEQLDVCFNNLNKENISNEEIEKNLFKLSQFAIKDIIPYGKELKALKTYALEQAIKIKNQVTTIIEKISEHNKPEYSVSLYTDAIKILFGKSFVLLPPFLAENNIELDNAFNLGVVNSTDQDLYLQQLSHTRPKIKQFETILMIGKAMSDFKYQTNITQLPYTENAENWIVKDSNPENIAGKMSILVIQNKETIDFGKDICGIAIDKWDNEMIPGEKEDTGLVFNYDQPSSEPPHAILIAVSPVIQKDDGVWSWENLVACINETFDLAKIRAVDSDSLNELSTFIPAVYKEIGFMNNLNL